MLLALAGLAGMAQTNPKVNDEKCYRLMSYTLSSYPAKYRTDTLYLNCSTLKVDSIRYGKVRQTQYTDSVRTVSDRGWVTLYRNPVTGRWDRFDPITKTYKETSLK